MIGRLALMVGLLLGGAVRLLYVEDRSLSHPEMWAPLIPVPWDLADPGIRPSLYDAVIHNLMADTHPPGYTIAMWFWMKLAGADPWALRIPSVLCGTASIGLLWLIARRSGSRAPWVAPLLLAFNGYVAMWSGVARMYAPAMCAVLLATWLLMRLDEHWRGWLAALYAAVLLFALSLHVYCWAFAGAHFLWCYGRNRRAAWWQMFAMIAGSPLLAFAVYQSYHPVAQLSRNPLGFLPSLFGFGALLPEPSKLDIFDPLSQPAWSPWWSRAVAAAGAALCGIAWKREPVGSAPRSDRPEPAPWLLLAAAAASIAIILTFSIRIAHPREGLGATRAAMIVPVLMLAAWLVSRRLSVPRYLGAGLPFICGDITLTALCLGTLVVPLMTLRGMQLLTPFILLWIAEGLAVYTGGRWKSAVLLFAVLAPLHGFSLWQLGRGQVDPIDFRTFAAEVESHVRPGETILWTRSWAATPLLHYLRPGRYRYATAACAAPGPLWWIRLYDQPLPDSLRDCVKGRRAVYVIRRERAALFRYDPLPGN